MDFYNEQIECIQSSKKKKKKSWGERIIHTITIFSGKEGLLWLLEPRGRWGRGQKIHVAEKKAPWLEKGEEPQVSADTATTLRFVLRNAFPFLQNEVGVISPYASLAA